MGPPWLVIPTLDTLALNTLVTYNVNMTTPAAEFAKELTEHLRHELEDLASRWDAEGRSVTELGSAVQLAGRMLATLPEPSPWDAVLGPFYRTSGVARLLGGVSRQAVAERRRRHTLLGLRTADGTWVYPASQFDDSGGVVDGLSQVLQVLAAAPVDEWTAAGWLAAGQDELGSQTVFEWLRSGGDPQVPVVLARDQARRYAR